jgi:hypothetical protein
MFVGYKKNDYGTVADRKEHWQHFRLLTTMFQLQKSYSVNDKMITPVRIQKETIVVYLKIYT